jgi:hypothetical protein
MKSMRKKLSNTINIEETLKVISQIEKAEQTADFQHNIKFTHNSVRTIGDSSDRIKESAKSETEVFV